VFRHDPNNPLDNAASDTIRVIHLCEQRALDRNGQALPSFDVGDNTGTKQEFVRILGNYHLNRISPSVDFDSSRVYRLRAWGLAVRDALLPHEHNLTPNELVRMTIDLKKTCDKKNHEPNTKPDTSYDEPVAQPAASHEHAHLNGVANLVDRVDLD
jgi:hypothetical protein